ncbi:MAG TPA: hypothetical protein VFO38_02740 [Candidatus Saccharimonadales bacterium]|nr:hypothetical protein [Candidatus Saccharimonadales bacterium]
MDRLFFGDDVLESLREWWNGTQPWEIWDKHPQALAVVVAHKNSPLDWRKPFATAFVVLTAGEDVMHPQISGPAGVLNDVAGKMRFAIRTRLDSREARIMRFLLQSGDYPAAGAMHYNGFLVGAAGLKEDHNDTLGMTVVEELCREADRAVRPALDASKAWTPGSPVRDRYLGAEPPSFTPDFMQLLHQA